MAKKVVASLRDKSGVKYAKLIKSVKSEKTGAYVFKEEIVIEDYVKAVSYTHLTLPTITEV